MNWKVQQRKSAIKEASKLPTKIKDLYYELISDLEAQGPMPQGWSSLPLKGEGGHYRIKLVREYRVIIEVKNPDILVVRVAHRKEAYK